MFVVREIVNASLEGLDTEPYTTVPASFVISTRLNPPDEPPEKVEVTAVIVSVLLLV